MAKKIISKVTKVGVLQVLPRRCFDDRDIRHTVVVCVVTPEEQLVLVHPRVSEGRGWILPQGGINQGESPMLAAARELREELGWHEGVFDWGTVVDVGEFDHQVSRHVMIKRLYGVAVRMRRWQKPTLNGENRRYACVGGPNHLWSLIPECSEGKRRAIGRFVSAAVSHHVLRGQRWQPERLQPLIKLACS
jgi:ADP-ribose pyrophosphatase YjhB (NUDIX family)